MIASAIQADRQTKREFQDEVAAFTGYHRISLIRSLNRQLAQKPRSQERKPSYGPEVDAVLRAIWEALDYVCPERLKPNLVSTDALLPAHGSRRNPSPKPGFGQEMG
ncbi:MAG: hypothetical protein ACP5HS_10780 [Anaerolineae bacterium]